MAIDHYSTATAMLDALRNRDISSTELVELHIERIEEHECLSRSAGRLVFIVQGLTGAEIECGHDHSCWVVAARLRAGGRYRAGYSESPDGSSQTTECGIRRQRFFSLDRTATRSVALGEFVGTEDARLVSPLPDRPGHLRSSGRTEPPASQFKATEGNVSC